MNIINTPHSNPGWALYLLTSDEDNQISEETQERQRYIMQNLVLNNSDMPVFGEYIDNLSVSSGDAGPELERLLEDARLGKFSHILSASPDRLSSSDTQALSLIDTLAELGVQVRFASYPDINPLSPDGRLIITMSFTLAWRESKILSARVAQSLESIQQNGGYIGQPPDGYMYVLDDMPNRKGHAKRSSHLEQNPDRNFIWREAWDLLLTDRYSAPEICEELHARGYRYQSGRPFVEIQENGKRKTNHDTLLRIFHNWTYAGWVVNEAKGILPKMLRGNWEPIVSTEEFEKGLMILSQQR